MRLTKKDIIYNKLNVAIDAFVNDSETFMTMYFAIKEYAKQYPSYYKTNFFKYLQEAYYGNTADPGMFMRIIDVKEEKIEKEFIGWIKKY